jgi:hypothetical protein
LGEEGTRKRVLAGSQWFTPVILAIWEAELGRIEVGGHPGQILLKTLSSKIIRGVAQAVEHLLYKCEALSSKLSPPPTCKKRGFRSPILLHLFLFVYTSCFIRTKRFRGQNVGRLPFLDVKCD